MCCHFGSIHLPPEFCARYWCCHLLVLLLLLRFCYVFVVVAIFFFAIHLRFIYCYVASTNQNWHNSVCERYEIKPHFISWKLEFSVSIPITATKLCLTPGATAASSATVAAVVIAVVAQLLFEHYQIMSSVVSYEHPKSHVVLVMVYPVHDIFVSCLKYVGHITKSWMNAFILRFCQQTAFRPTQQNTTYGW